MPKLLCTCPSRGRPKLLKEMLESFRKTRSFGTDVAVYLDDDDPTLSEYDLHGSSDKLWVMPRKNVAQIHNWLVKTYPDYDYYMAINDDVIFVTPGWDKILMDTIKDKGDGWGISYPDDDTANHKYNYPTFGMMSANMVKVLGSFYPPELKMMNGDVFLLDIGRAIGRLYYCPNALIKHRPPGVAAGAFVPGDHRGDEDFAKNERQAYSDYIDARLDSDVAKLFDAIINDKKEKVLV